MVKRFLYGLTIVFTGLITVAALGPADYTEPSDTSVPKVQDAAPQRGFVQNDLGITVDVISHQRQKQFKIKSRSGVVVIHVRPDSPADAGGMRAGDLIKQIDRRPIRNLKAFKSAMGYWERERTIEFLVKRGRKTLYIVLGTERNKI
jgi:S1-C subfamily serine protease